MERCLRLVGLHIDQFKYDMEVINIHCSATQNIVTYFNPNGLLNKITLKSRIVSTLMDLYLNKRMPHSMKSRILARVELFLNLKKVLYSEIYYLVLDFEMYRVYESFTLKIYKLL